MTEQEYCDLSDLQLLRAVKDILRMVNALEDINDKRMKSIWINIQKIIDDLEPKIEHYMNETE